MDKNSATQFKKHMEAVVRELSLSLILTQEAATQEEFVAIRRSVGHIMAAIHELLHESIYPDHPELNNVRTDDGSECSCPTRPA
jgi:DMSO/TMAO reductase YedYZ heme-binding membrane subunit